MIAGERGSEAPETDRVRARYRRLAPVYPAFDLLLALPPGARRVAVERLTLAPGNGVLEIGCGTGRNLAALSRGVGDEGRVYGVDATPEMLRVAERVRRRSGLENVELVCADAARWSPPRPVDGLLFSLSYSVIPRAREVLHQLWEHLQPGGRVVILDGRVPDGRFGAWVGSVAVALSRRTVLGDASKRPWADLRELTPEVTVEPFRGDGYYLSRAVKPG